MNVLVSGLVNIETPVSVRGFPINYYPIDYPFFGISMKVGGVGYNAAKALNTLGDNVTFVSFIGNDITGIIIEETLHKDGIETKYLQRTLECSAQSVVLVEPSGRRQIYCDLKDIQDRRLDCTPLNAEIQNADTVYAVILILTALCFMKRSVLASELRQMCMSFRIFMTNITASFWNVQILSSSVTKVCPVRRMIS